MTEKELLLTTLNGQRQHILGALEGLSDKDLRRPVLPTGWSCLGLVHHLALDVERFWFRAVVDGEQVELLDGADAWQVPAGATTGQILDLYRQEIALADAVIARTPLDAEPRWWPAAQFGEHFPSRPLRGLLLHVITETATHAGHLDAVRELIDGRTWFVVED
ncbi:DinB family protein [Luedemannella flava]|uniref:DinB family protein n=1 Tax=Luedemannella flava TaxID=349316 RepID=A0ABP4YJB9_9ACTN